MLVGVYGRHLERHYGMEMSVRLAVCRVRTHSSRIEGHMNFKVGGNILPGACKTDVAILRDGDVSYMRG